MVQGARVRAERVTRVAIIAAMAGELKPLVRGWPHSSRNGIDFWAQRNEEEEWIAACAGAGQDAATHAFAALEDGGPIDLVLSVGWAGALKQDILPGSAHNVAGVIDIRTGERFHCEAGAGDLWLVTSPIVADAAEKRRLAASYKASLVDMEAAALARLAQMRGISFYCFKGVSDSFEENLPDLNRFIGADGRFNLTEMILFSILRPWYWPSLLRMGENSKKAAQAMRVTLLDFLSSQGDIRLRNGYTDHKY